MSHEIMEYDQQIGRTMAWHGLTTLNANLALNDCWLNTWDYKPEKVQVNGKDTPFSILGVTDVEGLYIGTPYDAKTFKPVLNAKLLELLSKATEGKDMVLASCGTVKNRGRQFLSFQMGESYKAAGRDFIPFFNVGNGNDMSSPVWQNISTTCTVCNNTFQMNLLQEGLIMEVKKTQFSDLKMGDFSKAAKAMLAGQKEFADMLEALAQIKCTEEQARAFFAGFIGQPGKPLSTRAENNVDRLLTLFKGGAGNTGENFSDVFQSLTDFYTHESASGEGDNAANWKNYVSSEFGNGRNQKQRAWTTLNIDKQRQSVMTIGRAILKETAKAAKAEEEQNPA